MNSTGIVKTRQSEQHILEAAPVLGYVMRNLMAPLKKDIWEGCLGALFAAVSTGREYQHKLDI